MTDQLSIALAQLNPTVGDIAGNANRIREARQDAAAKGADLLACTELVLVGYPPEDLVLRPRFQAAARAAAETLARETADGGPGILLSTPWLDDGRLYNAALLLDGGEIAGRRYKHDLPNYGVFDEKRLFAPGPLPDPIAFRGARLGVLTCEDMWTSAVTTHLAKTGAELLIVPNGSPYEIEKLDVRHEIARARIRESGLPIVYVNQIGGQDELVFDGGSFVMTADGEIALEMPLWREQVEVSRWRRETDRWLCESSNRAERTSHLESVYQAIMIGLRDYVTKNKFKGVILGLSGGVDSALTAAVATDALGRDAVRCVMLPSKYTSQASLDDAAESAQLLGVTLDTVSIAPAVAAMDGMLAPLFNGLPPDLTEENVQSRLRGVVLMALSNKFGSMVVTTGNKSEVATGYATLYGDMCGGYSVLKDIYKTLVYDLCDWRNQHLPSGALGPAGRVVPQGIIVKPPSAELRPDQKDQDSLPPYEDLDAILRALMDQEISAEEVAAAGYPLDLVKRVQHLLFVAEYKRRQAAPGVKITRRNFGRDRRYPLTNGFRDVL